LFPRGSPPPPRQCGIATFTRDLHQAVTRQWPEWSTPMLSVTDPGFQYDYPDIVRFELPERSFSSYQRPADFINLSHTDLLCIQHEFGIYGGPAGSHLLNLMLRLRPIGSEGFWRRGHLPASHDQQPLEATAAVAACIEVLHATGDDRWRREANRCFAWFLGRNDLNHPLYDGSNGGCFDGLQPTGINRNQGAESTLSFLIALADMKLLTSEEVPPAP